MVSTPAAALTSIVWQAVLADPIHIADIREQTFQSHYLLRFLFNNEIDRRRGWQKTNGKPATVANGYTPKTMKFGAASKLVFDMNVAGMATTGAIASSAAISTSVDLSSALKINPFP